MNRSMCWSLFACFAAWVLVGVAPAGTGVGFNRDRSASFPDANPPFAFDGTTGENILWKTRLPNWSNSSPIVVNGRVFLTSEPVEGYAPYLHCIDAASGRELWKRELDPVAAFPADEQAAAREFALATWAWWRQNEALWAKAFHLHRAQRDQFDDWTPPASLKAEWEAIRGQVEALGFEFVKPRSRAGGYHGSWPHPRRGETDNRLRRLRDLGLIWSGWRGFGTWEGVAYPTPCSDGERVYTVTSFHHYVCYDVDGRLVWQRRLPPTSGATIAPEHRDRLHTEKRWRPGWPGQGGFSTSLRVVDGVLISNAGHMLMGLDAKTGRELWAMPALTEIGQAMGVPAVVRVDGQAFMISVGSENWKGEGKRKGDEIVRIRDGKSVGFLPGTGSGKNAGNGPIVIDGNLAVTWAEKGQLAAYRLHWDAQRERIVPKEVWRRKAPRRFNPIRRGCWLDGHVYEGEHVMDLRTGEVEQRFRTRINQGYCGHGGFIAGNAFCRWNFYGERPKRGEVIEGVNCAEFHFMDRTTGKVLGVGKLPINPKDGASEAQRTAEEHRMTEWRWLGAATPWAEDERLYIRSYDFLWCVGRTDRD